MKREKVQIIGTVLLILGLAALVIPNNLFSMVSDLVTKSYSALAVPRFSRPEMMTTKTESPAYGNGVQSSLLVTSLTPNEATPPDPVPGQTRARTTKVVPVLILGSGLSYNGLAIEGHRHGSISDVWIEGRGTDGPPTCLAFNLVITAEADPSVRKLTIHNSDSSKTLDLAFIVQSSSGTPIPRAANISPDSFVAGTTQHYKITGEHFKPNSVVVANNQNVAPGNLRVVSDKEMEVDLTIPAGVTMPFDVAVSTTGTTSEPITLSVSNFGPTAINPQQSSRGGPGFLVTMPGIYRDSTQPLQRVTAIEFSGSGIKATNIFSTETQLIATFGIAVNAPVGQQQVRVRREDGLVSAPIFFEVKDLTPSISSITPATIQRPPKGSPAQRFTLDIHGENLNNITTRAIITPSTGISLESVKVNSDAVNIFVNILISPDAPPGERQLTVTNERGTSTPFPFKIINQPPIISRITPSIVTIGETTNLMLEGDYFEPGMTFNADQRPAGMFTFRAIQVISETRATAVLEVSSSAAAGSVSLSATNSRGTGPQAYSALMVSKPTKNTAIVPNSGGMAQLVEKVRLIGLKINRHHN